MNNNLLKRVVWLAFQASGAMGMGFLHSKTADEMTEDGLWAVLKDQADRGIYLDYCAGRMIKTGFNLVDGKVEVSPKIPRGDYQSWSRKYSSAQELIDAAIESLNKEEQPA